MRFIHSADIHLDSPLLNLSRYEGAPVEAFRSATRRAFENLVELAVEEKVDFVLIAGDLYDGECKDMNTPIAFCRSLRELTSNGIEVFIVQGNHDAESKVTKPFRLDLPEGVHLFSTSKPQTVKLERLKVAIHGQGFAKAATEENLAAAYPDPTPNHFNIGLLHTNCGGSTGHHNYAPSSVPQLVAKGYDYWALGHIHKREVLHEGHPHIVYPGNIQGRNVRETGEKGCVLVTVEGGDVNDLAFHPVDVLRWEQVEIDAGDCPGGQAVIDKVLEATSQCLDPIGDRLLAVRVRVVGGSAAHKDLVLQPVHFDDRIREAVVERFDDRVWVEKIKFQTTMLVDPSHAELGEEALTEFLSDIDDDQMATEAFAELQADLESLRSLISTDPRSPAELPDLTDPKTRTALLDEVKQLLIPRLLERGRSL